MEGPMSKNTKKPPKRMNHKVNIKFLNSLLSQEAYQIRKGEDLLEGGLLGGGYFISTNDDVSTFDLQLGQDQRRLQNIFLSWVDRHPTVLLSKCRIIELSQPLQLVRMWLPSLMFDFPLTMSNAFNYSFLMFNVYQQCFKMTSLIVKSKMVLVQNQNLYFTSS